MKKNGIPVDIPLMQDRKAEAEAEMERIRKEIAFMIGDVNIGANCSTQAFKNYLYQDLGLPILKTTETNREAADDMTMTLLKEWCDANRPEISRLFSLVQEYRKWGKIKSTYIDGYLKHLNPVTGCIHPDLFALSTDTGRMNCRNPMPKTCHERQMIPSVFAILSKRRRAALSCRLISPRSNCVSVHSTAGMRGCWIPTAGMEISMRLRPASFSG